MIYQTSCKYGCNLKWPQCDKCPDSVYCLRICLDNNNQVRQDGTSLTYCKDCCPCMGNKQKVESYE